MAIEFVPVLLGSDINAYSMARAFHEAYGVKTIVYGMFPASVCAGSRIIDYRVREHNDRVDKVLENVTEVAREFPDKKILVLGCGDNYGWGRPLGTTTSTPSPPICPATRKTSSPPM